MNPFSLLRALALLGVLFVLQGANAASVNWGTTRLATNYTSDLQLLGATTGFTFEVGTFRDGFVPSPDNTGQWASHWVAADSGSYNPQFSFAAGSASVGAGIEAGDRGYIWGFDSREAGSVEWILVSDPSWVWQETAPSAPPAAWTVRQAG